MTHRGWQGTIAELAACDESPTTDGALLDWVRHQHPRASDVPALVALFAKADPHLQEAGLELATALVRIVSGAILHLEPALTALAARDLDPWVLEALVELLEHAPAAPVIMALAPRHQDELAPRSVSSTPPTPPATRHRFILRNRLPQPWLRLEQLYAQLALAAGAMPAPHDLAYLPILEHRFHTQGWKQTLEALRNRMRH
ncbi:MAG TPA: hypothetical protein VLT45_03320 [Kofleriaceae bacterium]|nr:hypothetical protein [Kofleriaceae bacterium]